MPCLPLHFLKVVLRLSGLQLHSGGGQAVVAAGLFTQIPVRVPEGAALSPQKLIEQRRGMIVGQARGKAQAYPLILAGYAKGEFIESAGAQVDSRRFRQQSAELIAVQHGVQCCQTIFR